MPPRAKKKAQAGPLQPQSEPEFLEAADDHEKAGGKWRAGDSARATRFFRRALDVYDAGLLKFPASFDLAYNKALLQYGITQDARIAGQFGDEIGLLRQTLESHRAALQLRPDNPDILFNTAQVLVSLAEALAAQDHESNDEQIRLVLESVDLFAACLSTQETEYDGSQAMARQADRQLQDDAELPAQQPQELAAPQRQVDSRRSSESSGGGGDWATVEEPVTAATLVETALAQLNALTTLVGFSLPEPATMLPALSSAARLLVETKIPTYLSLIPATVAEPRPAATQAASLSISAASTTFAAGAPDQTASALESARKDARLAIANWGAALASTECRNGMITISDYATRVGSAFAYVGGAPDAADLGHRTVDDVAAFADALVEFDSVATTTASASQHGPPNEQVLKLQWTGLSKAQDLLKEASESLGARTSAVYLARGDVDLKRSRLASSGKDAPSAERARMLLSNAGVFYRGAIALADAGQAPGDVLLQAEIKAQVVLFAAGLLAGTKPGRAQGLKERGIGMDGVRLVVGDMVEEGLLDGQTAGDFLATICI